MYDVISVLVHLQVFLDGEQTALIGGGQQSRYHGDIEAANNYVCHRCPHKPLRCYPTFTVSFISLLLFFFKKKNPFQLTDNIIGVSNIRLCFTGSDRGGGYHQKESLLFLFQEVPFGKVFGLPSELYE